MKNIQNLFARPLLLLLLAAPAFTGCEKDPEPPVPTPTKKDQIVGEWEIKSFTVDGSELKGSVVADAKIEFEAYSGINGDFEWNIYYKDGTIEHISGDYTVDETDGEIELEANDGDDITFDFTINGDKLELEGIDDGLRYELKADRD
jgi:Lipocalin-like domain